MFAGSHKVHGVHHDRELGRRTQQINAQDGARHKSRSPNRTCSQSGTGRETGPRPAPATTKRRVGAKSKKTASATAMQDAPVEDRRPGSNADRASSPEAPPAAARARCGKAKPAAETEDSGASTGMLRVARGRRTPTGTGAASNRASAGKGRAVAVAVAVVIPTSAKSTPRAVAGEKENTPERARVKEDEDDKVALPPVAAKGVRACKGVAVVAQKAQSEPEKVTVVAKTQAPRTRAASGRK
jgi:hypothetical protein